MINLKKYILIEKRQSILEETIMFQLVMKKIVVMMFYQI